MTAFIGHFHPVVVHLPIGILLLGALFDGLSMRSGFQSLAHSVTPIYKVGVLTAVLACVTGYMLSQDGGYDPDSLEKHQWMGIATAGLALSRLLADRFATYRALSSRLRLTTAFAIMTLLVITGHLGGTLTHGEGYLMEDAPQWLKSSLGKGKDQASDKQIANIQEAKVYDDLVARILSEKCTGCHGMQKQKGMLRLDAAAYVLQGGEHGKVLTKGEPSKSELYRRIMLPMADDEHMPPKEKPQLSSAEAALIEWWIRTGHDMQKKVGDLPQSQTDKKLLESFQDVRGTKKLVENRLLPESDVRAAPSDILKHLRDLGVIVMPIDPAMHYLRVNFQNVVRPADSVATLLSGLSEQVLWLDMQGTDLSDKGCQVISALKGLQRLNLSGTRVTDAGMPLLATLLELKYLNLTGTQVSIQGMESLAPLRSLDNLYIYKTLVSPSAMGSLAARMPATRIDTGGYQMPILAGDTSEVQPPPVKPK